MAAPAPDWPLGFRSPGLGVRGVGFWRPLVAVILSVLGPALLAWVLLSVAGTPGLGDGPWLRRELLFALYALVSTPLVAVFLFPVLWGLSLGMAAAGWAGLASIVAVALLLGLGAVHLLLHGDLTTEAPGAALRLIAPITLQAATGWMVFWALMQSRLGHPAAMSTAGASERAEKIRP